MEDTTQDAKKRKGRKPKAAVYDATIAATEEAPAAACPSDDENVIVHLNVNAEKPHHPECDDYEDHEQEQPYAYNSNKYSSAQRIDGSEDPTSHDTSLFTPPESSGSTTRVLELLKDFEEKNKNNEWPMNTSIACYWCCHQFNTPPFGLPIEFDVISKKFRVFGCFCSLECAAAHNFKSNSSQDETWERYNLINLLSRKIGHKNIVKPAPDRMSLKMFGGFMDIAHFRSYCETQKIININFPPMTSITQQVEEVNEYEMNSELRYIPIDNERINRYKEKMVFKRPKPNGQEKSILEQSMNLKILA